VRFDFASAEEAWSRLRAPCGAAAGRPFLGRPGRGRARVQSPGLSVRL